MKEKNVLNIYLSQLTGSTVEARALRTAVESRLVELHTHTKTYDGIAQKDGL